MGTIKRLLREFWLPIILSATWTAYNLCLAPQSWTLKDVVNIFGPTFFLASWMTGQFFRIQKQNLTEHNFEQIIATISGGETFPSVGTIMLEPKQGSPMHPSGLILTPQGDHSLFDLVVIVTDIEKIRSLRSTGQPYRMEHYQRRFALGTLGKAYEEILFRFEIEDQLQYSFHIQSFARNGQFSQRLLLRKLGDQWREASRIFHNNRQVAEYVQSGFPNNDLVDLDPQATLL